MNGVEAGGSENSAIGPHVFSLQRCMIYKKNDMQPTEEILWALMTMSSARDGNIKKKNTGAGAFGDKLYWLEHGWLAASTTNYCATYPLYMAW